jgi:hypothetical protein
MAQFERLNAVNGDAVVHWVYDSDWLCDSIVADMKERGHPVVAADEQSPDCHIDYGGSIHLLKCFTHTVEEDGVVLTFWDHQADIFLHQLQTVRIRQGSQPEAEYVKLHGRWYATVIPSHVVPGLTKKVQAIVDASNRSAE